MFIQMIWSYLSLKCLTANTIQNSWDKIININTDKEEEENILYKKKTLLCKENKIAKLIMYLIRNFSQYERRGKCVEIYQGSDKICKGQLLMS